MRSGKIGVLAVAALMAACSDSTAPTGDQMTREEALAVADAVSRTGEEAYVADTEDAQPDVPASGDPTSITIDHNRTHPCPVGGSVAVALTVDLEFDGEAQSLDYAADGTLTHADCAFVKDGVTLTVDGDPNLEFHAALSAAAGVAEPYTASVGGAFNWSASDERSGHCVIDLDTVTDFVARQRTVSGEVCGHTIDETITWN